MTVVQGIALFIAGLLAGALNSVAGGGSLISFPTLVFAGVPAISASATNSAAVLPGSIASIPPYRADLAHEKRDVLLFSLISAAGGVIGALLLAKTPPRVFESMIPYLMLLATIIFAAGNRLSALVRHIAGAADTNPGANTVNTQQASVRTLLLVGIIQFIIALYGGFFGAGIGIMMLAGLALLGLTNIHAMNALKVVLASVINGVAVMAFALLRLIFWPAVVVMATGAILGGWGGATLAHAIPTGILRWFVIIVGVSLAIAFFFTEPRLL